MSVIVLFLQNIQSFPGFFDGNRITLGHMIQQYHQRGGSLIHVNETGAVAAKNSPIRPGIYTLI